MCQAFLAETVETGNKNRCVIEATHVCKESLGNIKFRAFPKRVCPRILSLESVDYFGTSEHYCVVQKKKIRILISNTAMVGCCKLSCMQMALVMSVQFIFGDD